MISLLAFTVLDGLFFVIAILTQVNAYKMGVSVFLAGYPF